MKSPRSPSSQPNGPGHEVRLIGGRWKRTPLTVPDLPGLRPSPARVRETLFNWLGQDLSGWRVLDAFAGSGALGFEAASRRAQRVCMIEREPVLVQSLRAMQARLQAPEIEIVQGDALAWMDGHAARAQGGDSAFDLVLLDPPFGADLFAAALRSACASVVPGGWVYLEAPQAYGAEIAAARGVPAPLEAARGLRLHRRARAGAVHYHLFQCVNGAPVT